MWSNGDDQNQDTGDRVRLYQPILYSSGRPFSQQDATASYIGGHNPTTGASICSHCHLAMTQLVQLHTHSQQRTYTIVGCNRAACVNSLFAQGNQFACGGGGIFLGQSFVVPATTAAATTDDNTSADVTTSTSTTQPTSVSVSVSVSVSTTPALPVTTSDWTLDSDDEKDDDDDDDDDLERQIAAMELNQNNNTTGNGKSTKSHSKKNTSNSNNKKQSTPATTTRTTDSSCLPCFELHSLLEPPAKIKPSSCDDDYDDEEDYLVGASSSASDAKIQQMLARYMAEEDDVEILAALQGTAASAANNIYYNNIGKEKNLEKDERMNATDRALAAFTDRMQRSPRQVLRYAPSGIPLWSM
jgi:hypothetical protein